MKKYIIIILVVVFAGFLLFDQTSAKLAKKIDMEIAIQPSSIVLNMANSLQQKAKISYSIKNKSKKNLTKQKYIMDIGLGKINETSFILLQTIEKDVAVGQTLRGSYQHTFTKIIGEDGEHEIRFVLSQKSSGDARKPLKTVKTPVKITYE